jgi:hypothetical protein
MLTSGTRDGCLARLDALAQTLDSRLGPKPRGWFNPDGLDYVWSEYADIRAILIKADLGRFSSVPECPEPPEDEREAAGFARKGIPAIRLTTLQERVNHARTLLLGGRSVDQLDVRERARLENENLRLRNWILLFRVLVILLPLLGLAFGYIIGGCATLRAIQQVPAAGRAKG